MKVEMSAHRQSMEQAKEREVPAGCVYWITGLSGAGKTTLGRELWQRLRAAGRSAIFLDGDMLREVIAEDLGHNLANRRKSAMRNARLCRMLASQGGDVVCPTISMFHEVQRWNRENIPNYREIYLRVPMDELQRRDAKGIYAAAKRGELCDVVGLDVAAELPEAPDLILDNFGALDSAAAVERIWAECVGPAHSRRKAPAGPVRFATKAETLETLAPRLRTARVLPQIRFTVGEWGADRGRVLASIQAERWSTKAVIVRSSSQNEDGAVSSQAGKYDSVLGVLGEERLIQAIGEVIASFGAAGSPQDQIFVQPMLERVAVAGVAFSRLPSGGGPYYVVNYDDRSGRTDVVTAGTGDNLETFLCLRSRTDACPAALAPVIALMAELESSFGCDAIDVEFAIDGDGQLYLLQVRQLSVERQGMVADVEVSDALADVARKVELLSRPHPFLHGSRSMFGVMPDWNPAEIIGLRPRPLSLSLYRELITDAIWAYQRDNYGYKNLRSFPLLVSFHGLPYIDVRVSFNSFVPRDVPSDLAERLVNYYIDRLLAEPQLHDKVEFEIIFSCYTLDLPQRLESSRRTAFPQLGHRRAHRRAAPPDQSHHPRRVGALAARPGKDRSARTAPPGDRRREDRQDQPHLLAAGGLQALRHPALRGLGARRLHRGAAAAILRRGGRAEPPRSTPPSWRARNRRLAHRLRFFPQDQGRISGALRTPAAGHLRHPVAALRRGPGSVLRLDRQRGPIRRDSRDSRSRSSSCGISRGS